MTLILKPYGCPSYFCMSAIGIHNKTNIFNYCIADLYIWFGLDPCELAYNIVVTQHSNLKLYSLQTINQVQYTKRMNNLISCDSRSKIILSCTVTFTSRYPFVSY